MKKKLNYVFLLLLLVIFGACTEKPEEVVVPELPEEEEEVIVEEAKLNGYSPAFIIEGEATEFMISGAHFSEKIEEVEVLLLDSAGGEIKLEVKSVNDSTITAATTNIYTTGEFTLQVKVREQEIAAAAKFTVHGKIVTEPILGSSLTDGSVTVEMGSLLTIEGKNFSAAEDGNQVWFIDAEGDETAAIMVASKADWLGCLVPEKFFVPGVYHIKIVTDVQELTLEEKVIVEEGSPYIKTVSPVSLFAGEEMTINGKFFPSLGEKNTAENNVSLKKDNVEVQLAIRRYSIGSIEAEIIVITPESLEAGEYTLSVTKNGKTTYYNQEKIVIKPSPTQPVITSINQTSFNKGETIIITGKNLKKEGVATNINFVPFYGGTTQVRSAAVNAEGTQITYTIPADFPSDSYEVLVEVSFEYSESLGEIISIK